MSDEVIQAERIRGRELDRLAELKEKYEGDNA